jgi:hypothetical protein
MNQAAARMMPGMGLMDGRQQPNAMGLGDMGQSSLPNF